MHLTSNPFSAMAAIYSNELAKPRWGGTQILVRHAQRANSGILHASILHVHLSSMPHF